MPETEIPLLPGAVCRFLKLAAYENSYKNFLPGLNKVNKIQAL
jgi:hypothetical protein